MSGLLWNFALGLIVSFLGTLPLGVLNITIIRISIKQGLRVAFQFAVACALVELVYSYIAVRITLLLIHGATFKLVTDVISVFTLALLGCYYLRKNTTPKGSTREIGAFFLGSTLSIVNVIAFPFWMIYTSLLTDKGWVMFFGKGSVVVYVLGIALGTLLALLLFARLSIHLRAWVAAYHQHFDQAIGLIFIALSFLQTLTLFR